MYSILALYRAFDGRYVWFFDDGYGQTYFQVDNVRQAVRYGEVALRIPERSILQAIADLTTSQEQMRKAEDVALLGDFRGDYLCTAKLDAIPWERVSWAFRTEPFYE